MRRLRYRGDVEDATAVIVPFLAAKLNFLVYNDTYATKINKKQIKQAWPVVARLESLHCSVPQYPSSEYVIKT